MTNTVGAPEAVIGLHIVEGGGNDYDDRQLGSSSSWKALQLPDERFSRGQRSCNAMDRVDVTITYTGERCKAEVDQTRWFAYTIPKETRLELDCARNLFHEQFVNERPQDAHQKI